MTRVAPKFCVLWSFSYLFISNYPKSLSKNHFFPKVLVTLAVQMHPISCSINKIQARCVSPYVSLHLLFSYLTAVFCTHTHTNQDSLTNTNLGQTIVYIFQVRIFRALLYICHTAFHSLATEKSESATFQEHTILTLQPNRRSASQLVVRHVIKRTVFYTLPFPY